MKQITRAVWILSIVSLFTDIASEMLYPVLPIYLKTIGFSILFIGILEGIAEATAGLSKGYFGKLSDVTGKRVPFVRLGYALSAVSKPMLVMLAHPLWVFFSRTLDRFGKGLRTGARDALLSDEATPETKGKVFGFHRSMDTLGAVIGPLLALIYLYFYPQDYVTLFYLAFIPGIIAILFAFFLKDKQRTIEKSQGKTSFLSFIKYWKQSPKIYRKIVVGLLLFTLFNSSDVFLLLKAKQAGLDDAKVIGTYIFYNLIYAIFSFPLGIIADKFGLKRILILGLLIYSAVYFGFALNNNLYVFYGLFFLYGIYAAATEGISKAWLSNVTDKKDTATAIGSFSAFQSICTMLSSTIAGILWYKFGSATTFFATGSVALIVSLYFAIVVKSNRKEIQTQ
ncbi:MAG TPA: MFS transporter [Candidatus Kapabacteria bacterium]|nr:MFS transporter [Candidatus Kapabacteria bacterium]HPU23799.1 MFS transporter [Candidatus Kapabacteria bacterium]